MLGYNRLRRLLSAFARVLPLAMLLAAMAGCTTTEERRQLEKESITLDQVYRRIGLTSSDVIADMASPYGSAAIHVASKYGVRSKAYPDDLSAWLHTYERVTRAGVSDRVSLELTGGRPSTIQSSLRDADVIFYSPSPSFGVPDLLAAIKNGKTRGRIVSTTKIQLRSGLDLIGEFDGLSLYKWDYSPGVRDTVPPPKEIFYPLPPKPAGNPNPPPPITPKD